MPSAPDAGVPWSFYQTPVYLWSWSPPGPSAPAPPPPPPPPAGPLGIGGAAMTAGVPWYFYEVPAYMWFWTAALPTVAPPPPPPPGPPPPTPPPPPVVIPPVSSGPPVAPGAPSGVPTVIAAPAITFLQTGRSPVFLRPKPVYRPKANWFDQCLRGDRWLNRSIVPLAECRFEWLEECDPALLDTWAYLPPDMVTFNPVKGIPLPAPGSGNRTILEIQVPDGYDGIILAHFHAVQFPAGQFLEGSGDIAWRISADGRYLRDKGNMIEQQGQPQFFDPIPGGHLVRSKARIVYSVSVFNVTGTLPAAGRLTAGLHGWFFPRG